jgi:alpha-1,3-rhamnosyltransferase
MEMNMDESTQPLVSVIISSYNHAAYIEETIHSVMRQTYPNIELLVTDDASSDDTANRIEVLQREYAFSFKKQEKNMGLSRNLNAMINSCKGSLICIFYSDDIMVPDRIEKQVAYMQDKPEVGICSGNVRLIDEQGNFIQEKRPHDEIPFLRYDFDDVFLLNKPALSTTTLLIRRGVLEEIGGFDPEIRLQDFQLYLKVTHAGYYIDRLSDVLAYYRVHQSNTSKNHRFMIDAGLATIDLFKDHPKYEYARTRRLSAMFLKQANLDKAFARELLAMIPVRNWNRKVLRGLMRLYFSPLKNS